MPDTAVEQTSCTHEDLGARWIECMRCGDFTAAWAVSDLQLRRNASVPCTHLPRHLQYVWDGTPLAGRRVLIRCYHGLGDTIHFVRYMPWVEKIAAQTFLWIQPSLIPLVSTMRLRSQLIPLADAHPDVEYEIDVELMELPYVFRSTLETIPAHVPYLAVDPAPQPRPGLSIGLVWQAGQWDHRRSIPLQDIRALMQVSGVTWHILQRGPEAVVLPSNAAILSGSDDPLAAAQIMKSLDLVISVDSMPAHLAGALGVPVWTLLCADPDWRWMRDRTDCPWYPTMRLFRQQTPGDWHTVIRDVALALKTLLQQ